MTDEIQWSEEEEDVLYDFLVEKCQNTRIRFDIDQLCEEFRRVKESNKSPESVRTKVLEFRLEMLMSDEYDTETKIKMMFGLKARIGTELLEKLRKDAVVKLNGNKRIVFYQERIQGGLKLNAYENENDPATIHRTDSQMLHLIEKLSISMEKPISRDLFIAKYRESTSSKESCFFLTDRYRIVRSRIFESSEFDLEKKIRLMYFTNTRIKADVLAELRKDAFVVLHKTGGYIRSYVARDGSLELMDKKAGNRPWSEEDEVDLTQFCLEKCQNVQIPFDLQQLAKEFKELTESERPVRYIRSRIDELKINELTNLDAETRVKMMFALKIKIGDGLLDELCKNADVKLNAYRHIEKYTSHDGRLKLTNDRKAWSEIEENDLLKYLVDNCHRVKLRNDMWDFCEDYKESSGTRRSVIFLTARMEQLRSKINDSTELDLETKAQLLFGLGAMVREDLIEEFRKIAEMEVDGHKKIIMYKSNDGKLKLPRIDVSAEIQESDEGVQNEDSIGRVTRRSVNQNRVLIKKEIKVETGHSSWSLPMSVEPDAEEFPRAHAPFSVKQEVYYFQNPAAATPMTSNIVSNASENRVERDARGTILRNFSRDVSERPSRINSTENSVSDHTYASAYPDIAIDSISSVDDLIDFTHEEPSDDEKRRRRESADMKIAKSLEEIRMKSVSRRNEVESDEQIDVETIGNSDSSDENPMEEEETSDSSSTVEMETPPTRESMNSGNLVVQKPSAKEKTPNSSSIAEMVIPNENLSPPTRKSIKNTRSVSVPPRYVVVQSAGNDQTTSEQNITGNEQGAQKYSGNEASGESGNQVISRGGKRKNNEEEEASKRAKMENSAVIQMTPPLQSTPPEASSEGNQSSSQSFESIDSRQILEWMKAFIRTLRSTTLIEFIDEIDTAIRELTHQNIPSADVIQFLESGLLLIKSGSKSTSSQEESIDLELFLNDLSKSFFYLNSPGFYDFQKKIDGIVGGISGENKVVPMRKILRALQQILEFVSP